MRVFADNYLQFFNFIILKCEHLLKLVEEGHLVGRAEVRLSSDFAVR